MEEKSLMASCLKIAGEPQQNCKEKKAFDFCPPSPFSSAWFYLLNSPVHPQATI